MNCLNVNPSPTGWGSRVPGSLPPWETFTDAPAQTYYNTDHERVADPGTQKQPWWAVAPALCPDSSQLNALLRGCFAPGQFSTVPGLALPLSAALDSVRGERQPDCLPDPDWCSDEWTRVDWDQAVSWLAENGEWAILSTFTTYHSNLLFLLAPPEITSQILANPGAVQVEVVEHYPETFATQNFRNAVFCHDNEEGVHPWRLDSPCYLLCSLEDEICYKLWDEEAETETCEPWYLPYTSSLNLVQEWTCRRWGLSYQLYRVDEMEPYRALWARTGRDDAVARATFSLDPANLRDHFRGVEAGKLGTPGHLRRRLR